MTKFKKFINIFILVIYFFMKTVKKITNNKLVIRITIEHDSKALVSSEVSLSDEIMELRNYGTRERELTHKAATLVQNAIKQALKNYDSSITPL